MHLSSIYKSLRSKKIESAYLAEALGKHFQNVYLAVDRDGKPGIFFETDEKSPLPPIKTDELMLNISSSYEIKINDGVKRKGLFTTLLCNTNTDSDIEAFLLVANSFLNSINQGSLSNYELRSLFRSMVRLFSIKAVKDLGSARIGLWGELFFMRSNGGYSFWMPFWHEDPYDRYDFYSDGNALEVKTSTSGLRVHQFSHRQLYSQNIRNITVASIVANEKSDALTLKDLIIECRSAVHKDGLLIKLEKECRKCGMTNSGSSGPSFAEIEAAESSRLYISAQVPHFTQPEPPGVTNTKYKVDLTSSVPMGKKDVHEWLKLWKE